MGNLRGHMWLLVSALFFSSSIVSLNEVISHVPNFKLNGIRFILGGSFLLILSKGLPFLSLSKRDYGYSVLRGITGIAIYYLLSTAALYYITPNVVSILVCLCYIVEVIYSLIKKEQIWHFRIVTRLGLTMIGTILVCYPEMRQCNYIEGIVGLGLMILASVSWITYIRLEHTKPSGLETSQIVGMDMVLGGLCMLPFMLGEAPVNWGDISMSTILQLAYLAVFPSASAYYCYSKGARNVSTSVASLYMNLIPVISLLYITLFTGENLLPVQWVGVTVVVLAMVYAMECN